MATVIDRFHTGLKIGDTVHTEFEIREATAADLIEATEESERLVMTADGPALVASPTLVGLNTLRRQIVRIGDYPGPIAIAELKKLTAVDLSILQEKAESLDAATLRGISGRGRRDAGGDGND